MEIEERGHQKEDDHMKMVAIKSFYIVSRTKYFP
jgi:hypothetical protein